MTAAPDAPPGGCRILIMGAAGKDFHTFNVAFRGRPEADVVAFTATQIPNIDRRRYPAELAGPGYPEGIPIYPESDLVRLVRDLAVTSVVFAYSDVSHEHVMHCASMANAAGASFELLAAEATQIRARVKVVSVCAVRTGAGKSQTTRRVAGILREHGRKVVILRHPMPYGDLLAQRVQRFASLADMDRSGCTIEEREEYEHHVAAGHVVYAGVDYQAITAAAEREAQVLLWDGGNNDVPFLRSDLEIVVVDPHRPGHELRYHPGETNLRRAQVVVVNKVSTAEPRNVEAVLSAIQATNPKAAVILADSPIAVAGSPSLAGLRLLVVEDGPTLTHGEMGYGAGLIAAREGGAAAIVDPRPYAAGSLKGVFARYPTVGPVLPAMGYGEAQVRELEETIARVPCDAVLVATPIDLARLVRIERPAYRVSYELRERGKPDLLDVLKPFLTPA